MARPSFMPDNFTLAILAVVITATVLPVYGSAAVLFEWLTYLAIALLFFLHGAKLSREAVIAGIMHWRLHLLVFALTFILFPALGLLMRPILAPMMSMELYMGILYLCALPATVQSAIAFTSLARGNIPAAVCSASASTLLGIFMTPVLVNLLLDAQGHTGSPVEAISAIVVQLLLPFIAGQIARRWIGGWITRHAGKLKYVDQSSILLVVYTAFSAAVIQGLWREVPLPMLGVLVVVCCVLLAIVLLISTFLARRLGFSKEDEITIVFCGSKKSLATGVPMAQVLFSAGSVGAVLLPVMLFHQIQLMVCGILAQRYARRAVSPEDVTAA